MKRARWPGAWIVLTASRVAAAQPEVEQSAGQPPDHPAQSASSTADQNAQQASQSDSIGDTPDAPLERARKLFWDAHERYQAGDFESALTLFQESYSALPQPEVLFNIALAHHKLGNCERAAERLDEYLNTGPSEAGIERARRQLDLLDQQCPSAAPPPAEPAPPPALRPKPVHIKPEPEPATAPQDSPVSYWTPRRTAGWSALGAATLAGGATVFFELWRRHSLNEINALKDGPPPDDAGDRFDDHYRAYDRAATGRWIGLVATGGFAALGATLLLWPDGETSAALTVSPAGLEWSGRF